MSLQFIFPFVLALSMLAQPLVANAQASVYYRYVNQDGVKVIDDKIPPEYAQQGYDIVDKNGFRLKTIEPAISPEDLADKNSQAYKRHQRKLEEARLRAWDEALLLKYSSVDDIKDAEKRALREIKIRISILKSQLRQLTAAVEADQLQAANLERDGRQVSPELEERMFLLKSEIKETESSIVVRNAEMEEMKARYAEDIKRFSTLLETVKYRRGY